MFAIVILLTEPKHLTVVPMSWFKPLDILQIFKQGVSYTKKHRLFFSPDPNDDEPSFKFGIENVFDPENRANYEAKILSVWATYKAADEHMKTRRHVLPAIYNANLERYHWFLGDENQEEPAIVVKQEPLEELVWMPNESEMIDLLNSDDEENELNVSEIDSIVGEADDGLQNCGTGEAEVNFDNGANNDEVTDVKPANIVFPNIPNIIFDLTENIDLIRNVVPFSSSDLEGEMDCELEWVGEFPQPNALKLEDPTVDFNGNDKLLGSLKFTTDPENNSRFIQIGGNFIRMSKELYMLLLNFNKHPNYKSHFYDAKFVLIACASYIRADEIGNGAIGTDDARIQMVREIFRNRVQNDATRLAWFENRAAHIEDWISSN